VPQELRPVDGRREIAHMAVHASAEGGKDVQDGGSGHARV